MVDRSEAQDSWYFLGPRRSRTLHPILDLCSLNKLLKVYKFGMLTNSRLLQSVHPGDWFSSDNLKDAFMWLIIPLTGSY